MLLEAVFSGHPPIPACSLGHCTCWPPEFRSWPAPQWVPFAIHEKMAAHKKACMKHPVVRFKNLTVALKELEPFIRSGEHLQSGKPFENLHGMRSREAVANWLICVAANHEYGTDRMSFASDPIGGDGILQDAATGNTWQMEHVMVRRALSPAEKANLKPVKTQILEAVSAKQAKGGAAYASGKQLVVFLDSGNGEWYPNRVARSLPQPLLFDDVWVIGLHGQVTDEYVYSVTQLDLSSGNAPTWLVRIAPDFQSWIVARHQ